MVARAFLEDYSDNLEVNHKDESRTNNRIENLEMCNRTYNRTYISDASRELGLNITSIAHCCKGGYYSISRKAFHKVNSVKGFKFRYDR